MKRTNILSLITVFAVVIATLLVSPPRPRAQGNCTGFRAVIHGFLPTPIPMREGDTWGGQVYGTLGWDELLLGNISGNDGEDGPGQGWTGMGKGGSYIYDFGEDGSFTVEVPNAVWPFHPGQILFGNYNGHGNVVGGTGRFQNASGNLFISGPFMVYSLDNWATVNGRWNGEISGNICNVSAP